MTNRKQSKNSTAGPRASSGQRPGTGLVSARQRGQAFSTALRGAIKAMDGPDKVTDEQILGAFEIANEVWPVELEVMARAFYRQTDEP